MRKEGKRRKRKKKRKKEKKGGRKQKMPGIRLSGQEDLFVV